MTIEPLVAAEARPPPLQLDVDVVVDKVAVGSAPPDRVTTPVTARLSAASQKPSPVAERYKQMTRYASTESTMSSSRAIEGERPISKGVATKSSNEYDYDEDEEEENDMPSSALTIDPNEFVALTDRMAHPGSRSWRKGYLMKRSTQGWTRRFFVLEPPMLYTFVEEGGQAIGLICIEGALTFVVRDDDDTGTAPRMFRLLSAGGKSHYFLADSSQDAMRWQEYIGKAQNYARRCSSAEFDTLHTDLRSTSDSIKESRKAKLIHRRSSSLTKVESFPHITAPDPNDDCALFLFGFDRRQFYTNSDDKTQDESKSSGGLAAYFLRPSPATDNNNVRLQDEDKIDLSGTTTCPCQEDASDDFRACSCMSPFS